jgi:hypothetical protein
MPFQRVANRFQYNAVARSSPCGLEAKHGISPVRW